MKYCCDKFEANTGTHNVGFEKPNSPREHNGLWHVNGCCGGGCYVLQNIKFCPFCGTNLAPRFLVQKYVGPNPLPWMVFDTMRGETVAVFEDKVLAEQHARKLND